MTKLYDERRKQLGLETVTHSSRLKEKLIATFQGSLIEQGIGYEHKTLAVREGVNSYVKDLAKDRMFDEEMKILAKAAKIKYSRIDHADDLEKKLKQALNFFGPVLLEVNVHSVGEMPRYFAPPPHAQKD